MKDHHYELFIKDGTQSWGWQCFDCPQTVEGFKFLIEAEHHAADFHGDDRYKK